MPDSLTSDFINCVQPLCGGVLGEIQKDAMDRKIPIIPPDTARFLSTLLSIHKPCRVLEVGCAIGFSAGLFCEYLMPGGHVTTIDRYDIMIDEARTNFKRLGIEKKVTLIEGDACETLELMTGEFDLIFLDGAKGQYLQMLPRCLELLKEGGLLLADDVLQEGRIAGKRLDIPRRQRTIYTRMRTFLDALYKNPSLEACIVPVGDGLALCHKRSPL